MNAPDPRWPALTVPAQHFIGNRYVASENGATRPMIEARDCGKLLTQTRADVAACARYFEFFAAAPDKLHGATIPYMHGYTVPTWREPHGVTGHVIPWNYPLQIFGRSAGASLATGNACVVKPAEDACLSLLRAAELAAHAGFSDGALNIVTGLGADADLEIALPAVINAIVQNAGPALFDFDCGPLIHVSRQARVTGVLEHATRCGIATVACGSIAPGAPAGGYYIAPTLLRDVPSGDRIARGGVRHSVHGREKGFEALYGFTALKTVVLRQG